MKKVILISFIPLLLLACKDKKKAITTPHNNGGIAQTEIHRELYGFWVGNFAQDTVADIGGGDYPGVPTDPLMKLNIIIKRITKDTVIAQSVVAGKSRPLLGKLSDDGGKINFILDEPGSDKYDGRFEIKLDRDTMKGLWTAYKTGLKGSKKEYKLLKKQFVYNANLMLEDDGGEGSYIDFWGSHRVVKSSDTLTDGKVEEISQDSFRSASDQIFKLNASTTILEEKDLKNLRKLDLEIIKNTIFARHGYAFKNLTFRNFFDPVEWYVPITENVGKDLTPIENTNIKLINRFVEYAKDNYEVFGR